MPVHWRVTFHITKFMGPILGPPGLYIYIPGAPGPSFHYWCTYSISKWSDTLWPVGRVCWIVRMCTLSYYHHQTGSMNHLPLLGARSWNNGMRCMSYYVLLILTISCTLYLWIVIIFWRLQWGPTSDMALQISGYWTVQAHNDGPIKASHHRVPLSRHHYVNGMDPSILCQ